MTITLSQKKRLHLLLNQTGNLEIKPMIVSGFTEGRTEHTSEMTQQEAFEMIDYLVKTNPDTNKNPDVKMRRKIISYAYEMRWGRPGDWRVAVEAIDKFCMGNHGIYKKPLNDHTTAELVQVVSQFGELYKKHLKKI